jgi:hypothetical protein
VRKIPTLVLLSLLTLSLGALAGPKGYLFIIGGGERDAPLMKRYIQLAAGFGTGKVVVFTMASGVPQEVGPELVAEFKGNGAKDVVYYQLTRDEAMKPDSAMILDGVGGIWLSTRRCSSSTRKAASSAARAPERRS